MSRYFFDLEDGRSLLDAHGMDLPDLESARREAMRMAADFAANLDHLGAGGAAVITIWDEPERRNPISTLRLVCQIEPA